MNTSEIIFTILHGHLLFHIPHLLYICISENVCILVMFKFFLGVMYRMAQKCQSANAPILFLEVVHLLTLSVK
jgi:hypothetical protein